MLQNIADKTDVNGIGLVVSVATGVFSGFAPAWTASKLDPVEVAFCLGLEIGRMGAAATARRYLSQIVAGPKAP